MKPLTTTLNRIRDYSPCHGGWTKLLKGLGKTHGDDEALEYATILRINGLDDALWCARCEPQHAEEWRLYAIWCARQVQHLMTDERSIKALDVAEKFARGGASRAALDAAGDAAWDAAGDAARAAARDAAGDAAWDAAGDAARAAAWDAAVAAAGDAAGDAAWDAARAAAWAAAGDAAGDAARAAAVAAAGDAQAEQFLKVVSGKAQGETE